ncbi:MAG: metal ABC transporter substrate-binding protein [Actinomycetota bacterium]|nr:metal ABC transporter substrate-binding protein [Actinomycetota bacterium]
MPFRSRAVAFIALGSVLALSACGAPGDQAEASGGGKLQVVTTVAPLTSIAASVAGDAASISGLVPEGVNSHTFEPPPSAAKTLSSADVVFLNGLSLEEPTRELALENGVAKADLVELGTEVLPRSEYAYDFSFPKEDGKPNPHLWTDPTYAIKYADLIRRELSERDEANSAEYTENYEAFEAMARRLDAALRADQRTLAPERRQLLTYHDAYAYFARTYGWQVVGAIQPENFEDPTPREVAAIIDQIRERKVPTIFGSEVFPSKVLEQIGKETGARYEDTLRDDDLPGEPGSPEHSWQGLMRYDYVTMIDGLGGEPKALRALNISVAVPDRAHYPQ